MLSFFHSLLLALPPELAHAVALRQLQLLGALPRAKRADAEAFELMGLRFANRVGLAAGFDKNALAVAGSARLGFGFVEVGTVTPRAQPGQARPRVFRLPEAHAVINRMGFPNDGAARVASRLASRPQDVIVGVNIGRNAATAVEDSVRDYLEALRVVHPVADYVAVNISSPNTAGLRLLQAGEQLEPLLTAILAERDRLDAGKPKRTPVLVKISPDESAEGLSAMAEVFVRTGIDGVIATNTTIRRDAVSAHPQARQAGGLSGAPLFERSLQVVRELRLLLGPRMTLIGVGGIDSPAAARSMREAGADLVQLYTALIYQGPRLVRQIRQTL